jgi:hypothetical protein
VTVTFWAVADHKPLGEVLIPRSTKLNSVLSHERLHTADLDPAKATALGQSYWIKPELGSIRISLHMPDRSNGLLCGPNFNDLAL